MPSDISKRHVSTEGLHSSATSFFEPIESRLLFSAGSFTGQLQQWFAHHAQMLTGGASAQFHSLHHHHGVKAHHKSGGDKLLASDVHLKMAKTEETHQNHQSVAEHSDSEDGKSQDGGDTQTHSSAGDTGDGEGSDRGDNGSAHGNEENTGKNGGGSVPASSSLSLAGNGKAIAAGDTTPSTTDGTDFGSIAYAQDGPVRTFTLRNDTNSSIDISVITVPTGFVLVHPPQATLNPNSQTTFSLQMDNSTVGTKSGKVSIANTSATSNPFVFTITGTVTAA